MCLHGCASKSCNHLAIVHGGTLCICAAAGADDVFQNKEADDIYARDYSAPTGEDQYDKTILPKVMQVSSCAPCHTGAQMSCSGWDVRPGRWNLRLEWIHHTASLMCLIQCRSRTLGGGVARSTPTCWTRTQRCGPSALRTSRRVSAGHITSRLPVDTPCARGDARDPRALLHPAITH